MRLPIPPDTTKLRAAIKHVVSLCSPDELGMVKLHKTLYYADMVHFATRGAAITGAEYRKREHGPTCDLALTALRQLSEAQEIEIKRVDYFGYWKKEFSLLASAETNELSSDEKGLLADSVDWVCKNNTAKGISEISHNGPWERVEYGEVIPYFTAFSLFPAEPSEETSAWAIHASESVNFADKDTMAGESFGTLLDRFIEARS